MQGILASLIFVIVYAFIVMEKIEKTIIVVVGASIMLLLRLVPFETAVRAVDLNVIFLLVGMMTCVHVLSKTGFFEWVAISVAKLARGNPMMILILFLSVTVVLSAFLDNVTTIILIAPITILVMEILEISPTPFLILEAIASNIGGTATLIGDPPNILIGLQAGLSFNDFLFNLTPVITIVFLVFLATVYMLFRKKWHVPKEIKSRITQALPDLAIIDKKRMRYALWVLGAILAGFFTHTITGLEPGIIALCGSMIMVAVCRSEVDMTLMRVEWGLVFFFIGLFMIVAGLEYTGVISLIAQWIIKVGGTNVLLLCMMILAGSAVLSSLLDNIPFVITMIPMIKEVIEKLSSYYSGLGQAQLNAQITAPLWWSLALGACLGGNGTLIGASANLVMAKIGERNKYPITFLSFLKYGLPLMMQSVLISCVYIWLRYFLFIRV
ncbi:MAG: ArsB/NhaD family transporter [Candidatus Omnitrophica bacterium]|nr:ArsB/NhaD family transporter [Candidatus Omnitrophota bacterium]